MSDFFLMTRLYLWVTGRKAMLVKQHINDITSRVYTINVISSLLMLTLTTWLRHWLSGFLHYKITFSTLSFTLLSARKLPCEAHIKVVGTCFLKISMSKQKLPDYTLGIPEYCHNITKLSILYLSTLPNKWKIGQ